MSYGFISRIAKTEWFFAEHWSENFQSSQGIKQWVIHPAVVNEFDLTGATWDENHIQFRYG